MKRNHFLSRAGFALWLTVVLAVQACSSSSTASPHGPAIATGPGQSFDASGRAGSTYLSPAEAHRLEDLLPGPFPRSPGATPAQIAQMDRQLSDAEVQLIHAAQDDTSPQARARADRVETDDPLWDFAFVLGPHFNAAECPAMGRFLMQAQNEANTIKDADKKKFARTRPPTSGWTTTDSYPSGHSTRAFLRARLLAQIAPDQTEALTREARTMVLNRIIAGKHHPADCVGGIVLGTAIADAIVAAAQDPSSPAYHDLQAAKDEWAALGRQNPAKAK